MLKKLKRLGDTNITAIKSLGQHFLCSEPALEVILESITKIPTNVLEIGPGNGTLTKALTTHEGVNKIIAIEKDNILAHDLSILCQNMPKPVEIINQDALTIDFKHLAEKYSPNSKLSLISNLPYNVGTRILVSTMEYLNLFHEMIVMLQEEVADRIVANHRTPSYGRLSILIQALCTTEKIAILPPENFIPPPKVVSAIVKITPKENRIDLEIYKKLSKVCEIGFSQRRKTLVKTLRKSSNPELAKHFEGEITENARIEELSPEELIEIITLNK